MPHIDQGRSVEPPGVRGVAPVDWRRGRLIDAGFPRGLAAGLARDARYDLHALIELVERGCLPELAARILAPLDGEPGAAG
jgi:hypothetical protein